MKERRECYPGDEEMNAIRKEVFDFVKVGLYRCRFDGTVIFMDRNMLRFFDIDDIYPDPHMVDGKKIGELFDRAEPKDSEREKICRTGSVHGLEYLLRTLKGSEKWALHDSYLVRDPHTGEETIQAIVQDITERKRAEEALQASEHEKSLILESTNEIIAFHDIDNNLIWANKAYLDALNMSLAEFKGKQCYLCWGLDRPCINCPVKKAIQTGQPQTGELTPQNQPHWPDDQGSWSIRSAPVRDSTGKVIGAIEVASDITEQKKTEAAVRDSVMELRKAQHELQKLNATLEQRVHERTAQLKAANIEMEAFTYSASHDLRAPLRAIDGFSKVLLEKYSEKLDEEGREYLNFVRQGAQQMGKLIDDLLRLSRVGRAEMQFESVDLSAMVREIADSLQQWESDRRVEWHIAPDIHCLGDQPLLRIMLENLVGNAWKFTGKREVARIEFFAMERDEETVYAVRDNGAGFDMRYSHKLFSLFQRLHKMEEYAGTGIGLTIVQRIVARHGGRIWAEGKENHGAVFYFVLPERKEK